MTICNITRTKLVELTTPVKNNAMSNHIIPFLSFTSAALVHFRICYSNKSSMANLPYPDRIPESDILTDLLFRQRKHINTDIYPSLNTQSI